MNKYAIVCVSTGDLIIGVSAILNGLDLYGTKDIDFYLIAGKTDEKILNKIQGLNFPVHIVPYADLEKTYMEGISGEEKRGGWRVRFFRYRYAREIADKYEAIMTIDADMLICNDITKWFKVAHDTGFYVMPDNPYGKDILDYNVEGLRGAASPPCHNMPLFCNVAKHTGLYDDIWEWGLKEPYGDMVTVFKTMHRRVEVGNILQLPNNLWIQTHYYQSAVRRLKAPGGKIYLASACSKINAVHRRFWMKSVCEKFVNDIKEDYNQVVGRKNVREFYEMYKRLNLNHKVVLDHYKWEDPKI